MSRPLKKDASDKQGCHDHSPNDRRPPSRQQHVDAQDEDRNHGPHNLHRAPPQPKAHQKWAEQRIEHHAHQEDVQARHGEEVHESGFCEAISLGIGNAAPVPQQQCPEHGAPLPTWHVPGDLPTDVPANRNERILQCPTPISKNDDMVGRIDVQSAANAPSGQVGTVVKPPRIATPRGTSQRPVEPNHVSLMEFWERRSRVGPGGRLQGRPNLPVYGGCVAGAEEGVGLQDKSRGLLGLLRSVRDGSLHTHRVPAFLSCGSEASGGAGLVGGMAGPAGSTHDQHDGKGAAERGKGDKPGPVPPLHPYEQREPTPNATKPEKERGRNEPRRPHNSKCEGPRYTEGRIRTPLNRRVGTHEAVHYRPGEAGSKDTLLPEGLTFSHGTAKATLNPKLRESRYRPEPAFAAENKSCLLATAASPPPYLPDGPSP